MPTIKTELHFQRQLVYAAPIISSHGSRVLVQICTLRGFKFKVVTCFFLLLFVCFLRRALSEVAFIISAFRRCTTSHRDVGMDCRNVRIMAVPESLPHFFLVSVLRRAFFHTFQSRPFISINLRLFMVFFMRQDYSVAVDTKNIHK